LAALVFCRRRRRSAVAGGSPVSSLFRWQLAPLPVSDPFFFSSVVAILALSRPLRTESAGANEQRVRVAVVRVTRRTGIVAVVESTAIRLSPDCQCLIPKRRRRADAHCPGVVVVPGRALTCRETTEQSKHAKTRPRQKYPRFTSRQSRGRTNQKKSAINRPDTAVSFRVL